MDFYFLELPSYLSLSICGLVGLLLLVIHLGKYQVKVKVTNTLILIALLSVTYKAPETSPSVISFKFTSKFFNHCP